ncbi:hypothetical protein [Algirhabdus cladophorae]|uniref:hypothetical protein n=1 Tax=Algirhabdus cladophorae TaxID=3377108 RepID=UPI003B845368
MKRSLYVVALLSIAGCTTQDTQLARQNPSTAFAQFSDYPGVLFTAAETTCSRPYETLIRTSKTKLRCEALPPPTVMAQIILAYDGTLDDLPRYVLEFSADQNPQGYLAKAVFYLDVPQRSGPTIHVKFADPDLRKNLDRLLEGSGGSLLKTAP